ncbi:MAG: GNAT family N-acetyltransferase [Treponema sp.]|jgi:phosphinothricin acetyltransferase|nr:GNAT family N-acetyltransferase [Treponema sp.]
MIRPATAGDAKSICGIYNYYVKNTAITFEEIPVSINEMEDRIRTVVSKYPWLVWEEEAILGYAYINKWKDRSAYRHSAEVSIYVKDSARERGIGKKLFAALLEEARQTGIHALVAGITMPNEQSVGLHEKFGFKKVAEFVEIGCKMDQWLNVGYWQLILGNRQKGEAAP